jgi:hypothetical protein
MYIRVRCFTNLDDFKNQKWPEEMCCRPIVGDCVYSESGTVLKIVRITHTVVANWWEEYRNSPKRNPILFIELHKTV